MASLDVKGAFYLHLVSLTFTSEALAVRYIAWDIIGARLWGQVLWVMSLLTLTTLASLEDPGWFTSDKRT
jgi:hypothetical protein